jgi:hypothetical protein
VSGFSAVLLFHGTCTIRASQVGNGTYAAAPNVDRSFAVSGTWMLQYTYDAAGNVLGIQKGVAP